ncbi:hypothetical protein Hanom_Chr07g00637461 [Helianthus anomalus]
MLVWSLTSLNRFLDPDHLVSALLIYHIKAILIQSCVKMMVHKFISYFGVPLNGSFNIDRTFCDIHCFFDRKHYFLASFSIENPMRFV